LAVSLFEGVIFIAAVRKTGSLQINKSILNIMGIQILIAISFNFIIIPYFQSISYLWWLVVSPLFIVIIYGLLLVFKLMNKGHIQQFVAITNINVLIKYIRDEMND